jgi:hypothetical protein
MHFEEAQKNQRENRSPRELSIAFDDSKSKNHQYWCFSIVSDESVAYINFLQILMVRLFVSYNGNKENWRDKSY